ncbi:hypothetical protein DSL64_06115 [Dyadobacter luteus]|jgi:hypothetical protein|uniref:Uncharacterized protein n=1 Tax=Dyadobacter luteus TaxID=2259619 RepID=A0A3D8YFY7_9BACT|nr:T9SS type A sorting domain-containing protein [Dyadobacter luteus]REA63187.1 hypothetical protein DSL64_06115 [Dyadobacter luteus]
MNMNQLYTSAQMGRELIRRRVRSPLTKLLLAAATLGSTFSQAQSPGGVSANLRVWLRSDNGFTPSSWTDGSGNANHYTQTNASRQPFVAATYYNFNPVVDFGTSGSNARFMVVPAGKPYSANGTSSSVFTVNLDRAVGGYGDIIGFGATTTSASLINANTPVFTRLGANVVNYPYTDSNPALPAVQVNKLYINDVSFTVGTAGIKYGQNGTTGSNTQTFAAVYSKHADGSVLGSQPEVRNGLIGEVIAYERDLSEAEKQRVRTYTAIKYGITLPHNYIASNGSTIIWNQATNTGYNNNIAGIARDNNGALHQKQSSSINDGKQVLIGTAGLANTNALNTTGLTDGQFLVWGDNGLSKTPSVTATNLSADVNARFASIWKVQNVGTGTVRVAWPKGLDNLKLVQSSDAVIDGSDVVTAMSAETAPINGIVYNYVDVTLADGQFFTFAAKVRAPGGVASGLTQWYRADEGLVAVGGDGTNVTTWTDFTRGTVSGKIATAPVPVFKQGATNYFNFNPGVNFTAIQQMLGNITTQTLENTSFDIFTLTKEGMSGTRYFNIGMNNTSFGGANWDQPGLYASGNVATRNSSGGGLGITNPGNIAFSTATPSIMYHTFTNTSIRKGVNGAGVGTQYNVSARGQMTGGHIFGSNGGTNPPGGDDWGFTGHIGEVIIYGGGNLTAAERNRVDTYLAIKYGITLPAGVNYVNSNGTVAWDATANSAYHNNVAGIANDEDSYLNQKQSISVNKGQQVIVSTTGLTHTNAGNGTSLSSDGQYLIWGDNGLSKSLSASFNFPSVPTLNLRFAAIWKVQNTGSVGTVRVAWPSGIPSLTLIQSADATIDASDTRTDMTANSVTVNGVSYNYADVALSNGQFFTFAGFVSGPGNVASAAWYRADAAGQQFSDAGTTEATDGQTLQQWNEYKGTGYNLVQASSGNRPTFSNTTKLANFNPTVTFPGSQWMRYTAPTGVNVIDRANGSIFAAGYLNSLKNVGFAGFHSSMDYPGLHTYPSGGNYNLLFFTGGPGYQGLTTNSFVNKNYFTIGSGWQNGEGSTSAYAGATVSLNGNRTVFSGTNQIQNAVINNASRDFQIGQDDNHGALNGQLNEVVVFEQRLSEDEMNRVETYMAIKYGTTYAAGTKDYVNSSSATVWANGTNNGYHFNIAGIARDDQGSLYQRQSWSTNTTKEVLISTTGLQNTNAANTGVLENGQFLIWGDNGLAKSPSVAISGIANVNYRFASIWKAQNTGSVGTVRVAWPAGFTNLKLIQSADEDINASDVITDMIATQTINGVEYAYADVTLANGSYFTFAAFIQGPGGVTNNLSYWYRADKLVSSNVEDSDVADWTDFTSGTTISQLGENALPKFKNGNSTYFNFNPGLNYTAGAQTLGNTSVQTVSALNFDIYTLTKEGLASGGGNARVFSSLVDNITTTGGIRHWDGIGLNQNATIERVNTARGQTYFANPGNIAYATGSPSIMYNTFTDVSVAKGLNGAANGTTATYAANGQMTGGHAIGSTVFSGNSSDNAGFIGNIGEVIVYGNGNNSAAERNKVESYLAVKYGLTLANTNNYTTSQNVVVWNAAANTGYYNNVAGVGNDFVSALHQKQSRSQHANTNNQVTIGLGEIAETNAANVNTLNDGQFLVWGDNGNVQSLAAAYSPFTWEGSPSNGRRMNRIWKVQNTNNVSNEVLVRFPMASVGTTSFGATDACADYVIIFADDAAFTTNVSVQGLTVNGTDYDIAHTFPNGASYFTYGKVIPFNQGTVYLTPVTETTNVSSNTCDVGAWKYFRQTTDNSQKLLGITGYADLSNLSVTITPVGASYDDGTRKTNLMARITTITDAAASTFPSGGKVRIYYSVPEQTATTVAGQQAHGWYKYEGNADDVIANVYASGVLDATKATQLTPNATGVEDGVNYVEFHNITSFSSFIYLSTTESSALPVKLTYFNATKEADVANLNWRTTEESNNTGFEIQRSANARDWNAIGFVENQTEGGNSKGTLTYRFTDATPLKGINYYRLKQIDADGSYMLSSIVSLRFEDGKGSLFVYPNPVVNGRLTLSLPQSGEFTLSIYNISGVEVQKLKQSETTVDVSKLATGMYVMKVTYPNGETHNKSFVVK